MRNKSGFERSLAEIKFILGLASESHVKAAVHRVNRHLEVGLGAIYQVDRCVSYNRMFYAIAYGALRMQRIKRMNDLEYALFAGYYGDALDDGLREEVADLVEMSAYSDGDGIYMTLTSKCKKVDIHIDTFRHMRSRLPRDRFFHYIDDKDPLYADVRLVQSAWMRRI